MEESEQRPTRPLTVVMVMDTVDTQGNGTSNSALQWAHELRCQGHEVRLVGIGAPRYGARERHVPVASWLAHKQQMRFAEPDEALFRAAFQGADIVHVYLPFAFGRKACQVARRMGIAVTAGFHVQPENIMYSAGPLRKLPGMSAALYWLFRRWLYDKVDAIHAPTEMIAAQLRAHGYDGERIRVISNGYAPRFSPDPSALTASAHPYRVVASGRLTREKDHITLIKAVAMCRHAQDIELTICGTGPLRRYLRFRSSRLLARPASIGFHRNDQMPQVLRSCDLLVHPSIADIESLSVIEAMACGLVPIIASSELSATSQFALCDESLFAVRDCAMLANRIDWWLDDDERRRQWGQRYAERARERYSVASSVQAFAQMARDAMERAGTRR